MQITVCFITKLKGQIGIEQTLIFKVEPTLYFPFSGVPSDADSSAASNKISGANNSKPNRPSLAKILLSLDGNLAKQQALSHILTALQIMYAR